MSSEDETAGKESSPEDDSEALAMELERQIPVLTYGSSSNSDNPCSEVHDGDSSQVRNDEDRQRAVESSAEWMERGLEADRCNDFTEAVDCFSRALEIRVAHYGELAAECSYTYYRYGLALLHKAQTDLFNEFVAKKISKSSQSFNDTGGANIAEASSEAPMDTDESDVKPECVCATNEQWMEGDSSNEQETHDKVAETDGQGNQEGKDEDGEDLDKASEEDNDLDLAWKTLDVARVIVERNPADTMEKVDILIALGDTSAEREDTETSLGDFQKALRILVNLVKPDSRRIAELHFKICLVLQVDNKVEEAIQSCQNAISVCEARLRRLEDEVNNSKDAAETAVDMGFVTSSDQDVHQSDFSIMEKEKEIKTLGGFLSELREKMDELKYAPLNPASLSEMAQAVRAKILARREISKYSGGPTSTQIGMETNGVDSPSVSTAGTGSGGVTHLGVLGRGAKRAMPSTVAAEDPLPKRPATGLPAQRTESSASEDIASVDQNSVE